MVMRERLTDLEKIVNACCAHASPHGQFYIGVAGYMAATIQGAYDEAKKALRYIDDNPVRAKAHIEHILEDIENATE